MRLQRPAGRGIGLGKKDPSRGSAVQPATLLSCLIVPNRVLRQ